MLHKKWWNKAHIYIRQYVQTEIFENTDLKQVFIQKELESIDLSATNGIFVTKREFESNLLTTATEEPKLNHWVNTTLNQLVIQFEPSSRCILKVSFKFTFFLKV